jgi:hypothetical protein
LPFNIVRIVELDTDFGLTQGDLNCNRAFQSSAVFQRMRERRRANDGFPADWITVWYVNALYGM